MEKSGTPTRAPPPAPPQPHLARAHATARLPQDSVRPALGKPGGGFDSRRFQAEQPAAFKAPPSENGAAPAFSGPNPVFGTKKGPNRRRKRHEQDVRIGGIEAMLRVRAGAQVPRRTADRGRPSSEPSGWTGPGALESRAPLPLPSRPASTRRLPPHLTQANTSTAKVLRSSPAQSTRAVRSFLVSCLAAAWGATLASSSPAWGSPMASCPCASSSARTALARLVRSLRVIAVAGPLRCSSATSSNCWVSPPTPLHRLNWQPHELRLSPAEKWRKSSQRTRSDTSPPTNRLTPFPSSPPSSRCASTSSSGPPGISQPGRLSRTRGPLAKGF